MYLARFLYFLLVLVVLSAATSCTTPNTQPSNPPLRIPGIQGTNVREIPSFYPHDEKKYMTLIFRREFESHQIGVYINGHLVLLESPGKYDEHMGWAKKYLLNPLSKAKITIIDFTTGYQWSFTKDPKEQEILIIPRGTELEVHVGPFITV